MPLPREELLQPIATDRPGGDDIRYEPIYGRIKQARLEEEDLPAGDWARERKTANWPMVIELCSEAIATRSKDLQLAAWLTEAMLKREGLGGLASSLEFVGDLVDGFWDHLYPRLEEEDDLEFRAAPLDWIGGYLATAVRLTPINGAGHTIIDQAGAISLGYEADAGTSDAKKAREAAIGEGVLPPEDLDEAVRATPKAWYRELSEGLSRSVAALDRLDRLGSERFGIHAPRLSPLRDALEEVRRATEPFLEEKLKQEPDRVDVPPPHDADVGPGAAREAANVVPGEAEPAASGEARTPDAGPSIVPGPGGPAATAPTSAPAPASPAETGSPVPKSRADAEARVAAAAAYLRKEDPTDPSPYLLLRGLRWGELRVRAPDVDPRLLTAPPTEQRTHLRTLLLDGKWAELLEGCEQVMATSHGRGWLDLQRYVLEACDGLGDRYDRVAASIRRALQGLLQDIPGLTTLTLMDDTPTANAETRGWLEELGLDEVSDDAEVERRSGIRPGGRGPFERAMDRVRAGEPEKAMELLILQAGKERCERERFLRRSEAASIMVDAGRESVALPILEDLMAQIERHGLDEYEAGEIVAHPMGLLFRCMKKLDGDAGQMQELYLRICRLDPMQAIHLPGPTDT